MLWVNMLTLEMQVLLESVSVSASHIRSLFVADSHTISNTDSTLVSVTLSIHKASRCWLLMSAVDPL
jgi:hypothetical protein